MADSDGKPGGDAGGPSLADTVYLHLRAMAQRQMSNERGGHTLSATALVHEVYLKLMPDAGEGAGTAPAEGNTEKRKFYYAAGEAMRQILIDHARARGAVKRGGGWRRGLESVEQLAEEGNSEDVVALDGAFVRLDADDSRAAEVVRLRFYAGLSVDEVAAVLGVSRRSVLRDWEYAKAFLKVELEEET